MGLFYTNKTRHDATVTLKIETVADPKKTLKIGVESAMKDLPADVGIYDLVVGPDQSIELADGVQATFLTARNSP
jgi:hypothetical protein